MRGLRPALVAALLALPLAPATRADEAPAMEPVAVEAPAWERPPPPIETGPVVDASRLHRWTLENGLAVMVFEDHRLPRVDMGITLRRGAAIEPLERAGEAAFLADLMKRGAGERDALALAQAVDNLGGSFGVAAGWDAFHVSVSGLSRDTEPLFEVLADLALRPRLEPAEAERVRAEILAALEQAKDEPGTLAAWNLAEALYDGHRYGLPAAGTPDTVAGLDAEAARALHDELFVPGNAILHASGDVDPQAFLERARAAFGDWEAGPVPEPVADPPRPAPPGRRVVIVDRPDLGQAQVRIGHDGIARTDPDRIAASLMNDVLGGGGFSSRLMSVIREREGLAYGIGSDFRLRRAPGPFLVSTATRVTEVHRAIDLVLAELGGIRERPPTAEELQHAKTYSVGRFALGLETSGAVLSALVELAVHGLPDDSLDTYRARVKAVTVEDAAAQAREHVHPERAAIVVVGPAAVLEESLADLGPITIVQP
jgi:zinc protease